MEATTATMLTKPARILIVDDHPNTAAMLARVLSKFDTPVDVLTAQSGEEALELLGDSLVDVLITDFMMAGMNGLDLIEKLRGNRKPTHTIMITAYDTPGLKISANRLQVNDYLVKPVQPDKIREIVGNVLNNIRPQSIQSPKTAEQIHSANILIADDNPDNVRLLSVRLQSEGYRFIAAYDGQETLDKTRAELPDLILLDVNMPKKDGFEVLLELRSDPSISHIPVIVVTAARIGAKDVREGLIFGADDYVTKPVDWRELSARIRTKLRVKQAEDELRQRNKELGVLPEISKDIGENLDVEGLTATIISRSVSALNASNGLLLLFNNDGSVTQQLHKYIDISPWTWDSIREKLTETGVINQVINSREVIIIDETNNEPNWVKIPNDPAQSAVVIPLSGRRDVLGILILTSDHKGFFKTEHLSIIHAIASQAAIAIENAQLFAMERKRVNELVALNQLTHQISRFTRSAKLFTDIPALVRTHLGYPAVVLWLKENDQLSLYKIAGEENAPRHSLLEIAPQQAANTGQPAQFSGPIDERTGDRFGKGVPPIMSTIAVPLIWDQKIHGALSLVSTKANEFHESDRVLLETISAQIGIVMERIGLFESVEQEQKRLTAVLRAAADAILVLSNDGHLQIINPAGQLLFTDVAAHVGQTLPEDKGYDGLIKVIEKARCSGNLEKAEIPWPDDRTFSVLVAPISEGGEVAVLHDVSHFMAINHLKNEFLATATHDLKNPIFTVLGYSDLIERVGSLNETQIDFLRRIRNSAHQMQDLVINLLEIARLEMETDLKRERIDLNNLLTEVYDEFQPQANGKQHKLHIDLTDQSIDIFGDRMKLQQVARNLLGNAIKYTPNGGQIWLTSTTTNGKVRVNIRDTGIGIPDDAIPHLFQKFYRVHTDATQDIEGNGLGLAIVKSIIEQHGGEISVESKEGVGSQFSFSLATLPQNELHGK
jgi:signal transduction histidine kinase/DNA-binding response OmpR family regulator